MGIHFVLLISRQGKVRLTKWYSAMPSKERARTVREVSAAVSASVNPSATLSVLRSNCPRGLPRRRLPMAEVAHARDWRSHARAPSPSPRGSCASHARRCSPAADAAPPSSWSYTQVNSRLTKSGFDSEWPPSLRSAGLRLIKIALLKESSECVRLWCLATERLVSPVLPLACRCWHASRNSATSWSIRTKRSSTSGARPPRALPLPARGASPLWASPYLTAVPYPTGSYASLYPTSRALTPHLASNRLTSPLLASSPLAPHLASPRRTLLTRYSSPHLAVPPPPGTSACKEASPRLTPPHHRTVPRRQVCLAVLLGVRRRGRQRAYRS